MSGIIWRADIENAPKDGTEVLAWFPLEDLGDRWCRAVPVYWSHRESRWNFASRAASGFSRSYLPTHWAPINGPDNSKDHSHGS